MNQLVSISHHLYTYNCRVAGLCKDYCGILNEEAIRLNFVLIYELLDEVMVSCYLRSNDSCIVIRPV